MCCNSEDSVSPVSESGSKPIDGSHPKGQALATPSRDPRFIPNIAKLGNFGLSVCLFVVLFVIYISNLHVVWSGDSFGTRLIPLSILLDGDCYLDSFVPLYVEKGGAAHEAPPHQIAFRRGHWVSTYPLVTPTLITPLYIPLAWYIRHGHRELNSLIVRRMIDLMEKLSSAVIAALSAVFLFLCLSHLTRRPVAFGLTLLYALASNTWVIGSQALWQHGMSELMIGASLWMLLISDSNPAFLLGSGLAVALATANRPPNVIFAMLLSLYVLRRYRTRGWPFFIAPIAVGVMLVWFNLYYFGALSGGYAGQEWSTPAAVGLAGLLFNPSHGLFVYTPWTIFSCWGIALLFTSSGEPPLFKYLAFAVIGEILLYSKWWCWWGAWCFGPRMLTDILPLLTILLLPALRRWTASGFVRASFVAVAIFSLGVQIIGAYFHFEQDIEADRLWSWSDSQLVEAVGKHRPAFWSPHHSGLGNYFESREGGQKRQ